jgi:hypothetical protein
VGAESYSLTPDGMRFQLASIDQRSRPTRSHSSASGTFRSLRSVRLQSYLRPDRPGGSGRVEAYNPESRRGHLKEDDSDEGIGLFQVHAMGPRLSPRRDPDSPRNRRKRRPRDGRSTHESTLAARPDGNRTSDQMVGGSNPSGRATFPRETALLFEAEGRRTACSGTIRH